MCITILIRYTTTAKHDKRNSVSRMTDFTIQPSSDVPIYRQLTEQVRRMAASGRLIPGDRLPSVRQLAEQLAVNPMTVSKAYSQLEAAGLLERRRGIGMVLKEDANSREELISPAIDELVAQARQLGFDRKTIVARINDAWEEK